MSEHHATVDWQRKGAEFAYETYPRSHELRFAHASVPGTAAPGNRPSTAEGAPGVDPEEAFVGALSSCHMLWFLHLACEKKWVVDRYLDEAVGVLDKTWVSRVTLRPVVSFSGAAPSPEEHQALHEKAHQRCFIANSVKTDVLVEPRIA